MSDRTRRHSNPFMPPPKPGPEEQRRRRADELAFREQMRALIQELRRQHPLPQEEPQ